MLLAAPSCANAAGANPPSSAALTLVRLEPLPENDVAVTLPLTVWLPVKVLAVANCGTLVVSTFSVTLPLVPPPVRSVPAVTPAIVPGKVCPDEKVTAPVKLPVPCTSSPYAGVVVPIPTLTLPPQLFSPLIQPSTRALLSPTRALEPRAVALVMVPVDAAAPEPRNVLLPAVMLLLSRVCPAKR